MISFEERKQLAKKTREDIKNSYYMTTDNYVVLKPVSYLVLSTYSNLGSDAWTFGNSEEEFNKFAPLYLIVDKNSLNKYVYSTKTKKLYDINNNLLDLEDFVYNNPQGYDEGIYNLFYELTDITPTKSKDSKKYILKFKDGIKIEVSDSKDKSKKEIIAEAKKVYKDFKDSQGQEISNSYKKLSKEYNCDLEKLIYGKDGFMETFYPNGFPDFGGDIIFSEKYWDEFINWAKENNKIDFTNSIKDEELEEVEAEIIAPQENAIVETQEPTNEEIFEGTDTTNILGIKIGEDDLIYIPTGRVVCRNFRQYIDRGEIQYQKATSIASNVCREANKSMMNMNDVEWISAIVQDLFGEFNILMVFSSPYEEQQVTRASLEAERRRELERRNNPSLPENL